MRQDSITNCKRIIIEGKYHCNLRRELAREMQPIEIYGDVLFFFFYCKRSNELWVNIIGILLNTHLPKKSLF